MSSKRSSFWLCLKSYCGLLSYHKMDILQCKCITLLNVTLTVLVVYRSWERSNYKLIRFLILRGKSHKVIVKSLILEARHWGKVSDLPGLPFLICGKRTHSIGKMKCINTKFSKNQTANMLWIHIASMYKLWMSFFINFWKVLGNQKRISSTYKEIN